MENLTEIQELAKDLDIPYYEELPVELNIGFLSKVPFEYARDNEFVPIRETETQLIVATSNPLNIHALDDLRLTFDKEVDLVLTDSITLQDYISKVYSLKVDSAEQTMTELKNDDIEAIAQEVSYGSHDLLDSTENAPIIRLLNSIIHQAIKDNASDIHIEPFEKELVIRFRMDGMLYNIISPPKKLYPYIISRVKVMGSMDVAEKRLPQDGRTKVTIGNKDIDIRISVLPTSFGERIVLRLLKKNTELLDLDRIIPSPSVLELLKSSITKTHGIILVTGPTGSGKTTTLYSALTAINSPDKNIITVEDPIEYQLKGIGQLQVNPKINLTFANGLRSILRQDPDVIMIGEIRDVETAEIAIHASLTGHLVFSTLHTNDAAGAVARLIDMNIEPFLISSSLVAVVAQRLVRTLCPECKVPHEPESEELRKKGAVFFKHVGCDACMKTGYHGRIAVHEYLDLNEDIIQLINNKASSTALKKMAIEKGMITLREQAMQYVLEGRTSLEEIMRVIPQDEQ